MPSEGERIARVGPKGQVVIPKEIRERLGIVPGQAVRVYEADGEARVQRALSLDELRGIFKDGPGGGTAELEAERRREREREERKIREWER